MNASGLLRVPGIMQGGILYSIFTEIWYPIGLIASTKRMMDISQL